MEAPRKASSAIVYMDDREVWEQHPYETSKQYERFLKYRDMGRMRSLKGLIKVLAEFGDELAYNTLKWDSCTYRWVDRAESWDAYQDAIDREQMVAARKAMIARHREVASALLDKAIRALDETGPEALDPDQIMRWIKLATDIESKVLGSPERTVSITGPSGGPIQTEDLTNLSDEARRARIRELATEIANRAGLTTSVVEDGE